MPSDISISPGFLCLVCGKPMPSEELNLNRSWHFDCQRCAHCNGETTTDIVLDCLRDNRPIAHTPCATAAALRQIKNETIPLTQLHVRACNQRILPKQWSMVRPDSGDSQLLFDFLKDLQELASNISTILSATRNRIQIDESREYTEKVQKEKKIKADESAEEQARKNQLQAERADSSGMLKAERKAYEGFKQMFGETIAKQMIEQARQKKDPSGGGTIQ